MTLKEKTFENIVGNGANTDNQHFIFFLFESHLFCRLQMLWIQTSLDCFRLVELNLVKKDKMLVIGMFSVFDSGFWHVKDLLSMCKCNAILSAYTLELRCTHPSLYHYTCRYIFNYALLSLDRDLTGQFLKQIRSRRVNNTIIGTKVYKCIRSDMVEFAFKMYL